MSLPDSAPKTSVKNLMKCANLNGIHFLNALSLLLIQSRQYQTTQKPVNSYTHSDPSEHPKSNMPVY